MIATALSQGRIDTVVQMVERLAAINDSLNPEGVTTFMMASGVCSSAELQLLMPFGPDVLAVDRCGRTALHFACRAGNLDAFNFLIEFENVDYDAVTTAGVTPLMNAVQSENQDLVQRCLQANLNPFLKDALGRVARDYTQFCGVAARTGINNMIDQAVDQWMA